MRTLLSSFLLTILCALGTFGDKSSVTHGTLIVIVPTQAGFIIASDSRAQTAGKTKMLNCDDATKLFPLTNHTRSMIAVSGVSSLTNPGTKAENCEEIKSQVLFGHIVKKYLDERPGEITRKVFESAQGPILRFVSRLHETVVAPKPDKVFLTIVFGKYAPEDGTIVFAYFKLCVQDGHLTKICDSDWNVINQNQVIAIKLQGVANCFLAARSIDGRKIIGANYLKAYDSIMGEAPLVANVSHDKALLVATDILQTTEKYCEITKCEDDGVGGPIHAYLVDFAHTRPFRLLPLDKN